MSRIRVEFLMLQASGKAEPRLRVDVNGVRVSYRIEAGREVGNGWRCAEHFRGQECPHVCAVIEHLSPTVRVVRPKPPVTVVVKRRRPNPSRPGHDLVTVDCPCCGKEHTHGAPSGEAPGHRLADCVGKPRKGYVIVNREAGNNATK